MSFQDLYDQVMIKEEDIESAGYSDEIGDFPAAAGEGNPAEPEQVPDEMGAEVTITLSPEQVEVLKSIFAQIEGMGSEEGEMGAEAGEEMGGEEMAPVQEMKSEPEPKSFDANIKALQAPKKLGGTGVKAAGKKKATTATATGKARTGELETAPAGFKPGDKGMMKVDGSGAAQSGKNASMLEQ